MIRSLKFASIPVSDQDRSLAFFTEKLGFQVATDQPFDDTQRWIELRIPGGDARVVLFTPKEHVTRIGSFTGLSFATDDVMASYRELSARGVEFVGEPRVAEWGSSAVFKDPDGNSFVLSSK
jgi:catechol 2,3-dioxygenase-like lactoylglutathione lyase family enzyme